MASFSGCCEDPDFGDDGTCLMCGADAPDDEPQEDDYVTEDHLKFYQNRKLVIDMPIDTDWSVTVKAIKAHMEKTGWFPNVWFISDHGNVHLLTLEDDK